MVYVFEGARNSGKTFLSTHASKTFGIPRFQFNFAGSFGMLNLDSKSRESHVFALGKELMLMQLAKDLSGRLPNFIHDRGILSVLGWGICEGRISKGEALKQIDFILENKLMQGIKIIYIEGENPDQGPRNKDQWDFADKGAEERNSYEWLLTRTHLDQQVTKFINNFDPESIKRFDNLFSGML